MWNRTSSTRTLCRLVVRSKVWSTSRAPCTGTRFVSTFSPSEDEPVPIAEPRALSWTSTTSARPQGGARTAHRPDVYAAPGSPSPRPLSTVTPEHADHRTRARPETDSLSQYGCVGGRHPLPLRANHPSRAVVEHVLWSEHGACTEISVRVRRRWWSEFCAVESHGRNDLRPVPAGVRSRIWNSAPAPCTGEP